MKVYFYENGRFEKATGASIFKQSDDADLLQLKLPMANVDSVVHATFLLPYPEGSEQYGQYSAESLLLAVMPDEEDGGYLWQATLPGGYLVNDGTAYLSARVRANDGTPIKTTEQVQFIIEPSGDYTATAVLPEQAEQILSQIATIQANILDLQQTKQDKEDQALETEEKTVVGAINGLNTRMGTAEANINTNTENIAENRTQIDLLREQYTQPEEYIGQLTGSALPTNGDLTQFVIENTDPSRQPKNGDVVIFILKIEGDTDKNYKYIYSTSGWNGYEIPAIEEAYNGSLGIIEGTYNIGSANNTLVDISGGQILNIYVKDASDNYRNIVEYANTLNADIQKIVDGDTPVGVALKAVADELGNNIVNTYLTQTAGATKQYVRDYALPRVFNDVLFIASSGYQKEVPDTPASGIQFETTASSVGDFTIFELEKVAEADYTLSNKNSSNNTLWLSANQNCIVQFRLTTQAKKALTNEWEDLNIELSNLLSLDANEIYKVQFGGAFVSLGENTIDIQVGDQIKQTLEVITQESISTTFSLYSDATYPSTFNLNTQTQTIITAQGMLGEEPVYTATGSFTDSVLTFELPDNAIINKNTEAQFILTTTETLEDTTEVQIALAGENIRIATPYNYETGNATFKNLRQTNKTTSAGGEITFEFKGFIKISGGATTVIVDEDNLVDFADKEFVQTENSLLKQYVDTQDGNLQANINNEAQDRENADKDLQTNIDNEAQDRERADGVLQTNIDNEAQARENADDVLQANIDNLKNYLENQDIAYIGRITQVDFNAVLENDQIIGTLDPTIADFEFTQNTQYLIHVYLPIVTLTGTLDNTYPIYLKDKDDNVIYIGSIFKKELGTTSTVGDLCQIQNYFVNIGYSWDFSAFYRAVEENGNIIRTLTTDTVVRETNPSMTGLEFATGIENASLKIGTVVKITTPYSSGDTNYYTGHSYEVLGRLQDGQIVLSTRDITTFVDFVNPQELTDEQQGLVRQKIGAGASSFSGSYQDLTQKPVLNTDNTDAQTPSEDEEINGTVNLHKVAKTGSFTDLNNIPSATNASAGIIQIATNTEAEAGTVENKAVNPKRLKVAIEGLGTVFTLKGSVQSVGGLPATGNQYGDVWYVINESVGYIWLNDGSTDKWEQLGLPLDLSGYVEIASIVNNLTTQNANKPLSANQGYVLKGLIDAINTTLADHGTRLSTAEDNITMLDSDVGDLQADNTTNKSNISTVQSNLATEITNRGNADTELSGRIDTTNANLTTLDGQAVKTSGNQTIAGVKIFSSAPKLSTNTITTSSGNTVTIPNYTSTLVNLGTAQTITANKTFSGTVNVSGLFQIGGKTISYDSATDTFSV